MEHQAQSFFLLFNDTVFKSQAFSAFWSRYAPYSSRVHAIKRGERRLSTKLMKAGFFPFCLYNAVSLHDTIQELLNSENDKRSVSNLLLQTYGEPAGSRRRFPFIPSSYTYQAVQLALLRACSAMHMMNPTHVCGVILNVTLDAPIKRDVCYRGVCDMVNLLAYAKGFTESEKVMMAIDLRKKGFPASIVGLRRILYNWGRV